MHVEITTIDGRVWVGAPDQMIEEADVDGVILLRAEGAHHHIATAYIIATSVIADE